MSDYFGPTIPTCAHCGDPITWCDCLRNVPDVHIPLSKLRLNKDLATEVIKHGYGIRALTRAYLEIAKQEAQLLAMSRRIAALEEGEVGP